MKRNATAAIVVLILAVMAGVIGTLFTALAWNVLDTDHPPTTGTQCVYTLTRAGELVCRD